MVLFTGCESLDKRMGASRTPISELVSTFVAQVAQANAVPIIIKAYESAELKLMAGVLSGSLGDTAPSSDANVELVVAQCSSYYSIDIKTSPETEEILSRLIKTSKSAFGDDTLFLSASSKINPNTIDNYVVGIYHTLVDSFIVGMEANEGFAPVAYSCVDGETTQCDLLKPTPLEQNAIMVYDGICSITGICEEKHNKIFATVTHVILSDTHHIPLDIRTLYVQFLSLIFQFVKTGIPCDRIPSILFYHLWNEMEVQLGKDITDKFFEFLLFLGTKLLI